MSVNALAFVFGAFLVVTAILGGGFEIKEIKIPKVGWIPRVLATLCGLVFVGLGIGLSVQPKASALGVVAAAPAASPPATTVTVARVRAPQPARPAHVSAPSAPPFSGAIGCGGGLIVGAHTSCAFAENVRAAYEQSGSRVLDVYSPTTGLTYRMYCTAGDSHVCTGGQGASVYFS